MYKGEHATTGWDEPALPMATSAEVVTFRQRDAAANRSTPDDRLRAGTAPPPTGTRDTRLRCDHDWKGHGPSIV